jgi:hypothetical protein
MIPKLSGAAVALALTFSQPAIPAVGDPDFATVRAATARFQDVNVAIADGYVQDPMNRCDTAQMMGWSNGPRANGVHYFRPDLVGIKTPPSRRSTGSAAHTDVVKPDILVYEPREDGSLELVAVENLVVKWAWREKGKAGPPKLQGVLYEPMKDNPATKVDEAQMFEPRYDRRVWIFSDHPKGLFVPYDPNENCAAQGASNVSAS